MYVSSPSCCCPTRFCTACSYSSMHILGTWLSWQTGCADTHVHLHSLCHSAAWYRTSACSCLCLHTDGSCSHSECRLATASACAHLAAGDSICCHYVTLYVLHTDCSWAHQRSATRDGPSRGKKESHPSITNIHIPLAVLVIGSRPNYALHVFGT